jgi:hypothetical protein
VAHAGHGRRLIAERLGHEAEHAPVAAGAGVGDPEREGLEERRSGSIADAFPPLFPPGPADRAGWDAWLRRGESRPVLRRSADGPAAFVDRTDRLRCLGNAVVPLVAAHAFRALARRVLSG